ncbi:hypothetical protein B0H10DRAFT_1953104 [Mycena sp. CBHHK59/15]|nr:hypothetical protein B0H10DRAFT_1953104 [Mycena sp. CBHHK59/15]
MYQWMNSRPDNKDTPAECKAKEDQLSTAFLQYLSATGPFAGWKESQANFEKQMGRNPIAVWVAFKTPEIVELADYAVLLLKIVVNQAGCERVFSDVKVKQMQCRNRLKLVKLDKMMKIAADSKVNHLERSLVTLRDSKWKKTTLAQLFGGAKKHAKRLLQEEIEAEVKLMVSLVEAEALAEVEEDAQLDDGAVDIGSEEEYVE